MPIPQCLGYNSYVVSFETGTLEFSNFVVHFPDCFGCSVPLYTLMNFRISLSTSAEKSAGILKRIVLKLKP